MWGWLCSTRPPRWSALRVLSTMRLVPVEHDGAAVGRPRSPPLIEELGERVTTHHWLPHATAYPSECAHAPLGCRERERDARRAVHAHGQKCARQPILGRVTLQQPLEVLLQQIDRHRRHLRTEPRVVPALPGPTRRQRRARLPRPRRHPRAVPLDWLRLRLTDSIARGGLATPQALEVAVRLPLVRHVVARLFPTRAMIHVARDFIGLLRWARRHIVRIARLRARQRARHPRRIPPTCLRGSCCRLHRHLRSRTAGGRIAHATVEGGQFLHLDLQLLLADDRCLQFRPQCNLTHARCV
eukprot:4340857-Prymnesium_polylepis.1